MLSVYTAKHKLRDPKTELDGGQLIIPHECPARAETVLERVKETQLGAIIEPEVFSLEAIKRIHSSDYVNFLEQIWDEWVGAGYEGEAIANIWPSRRAGRLRVPDDAQAKLGYYALAGETSICAGTWQAACAAANVALTGAQKIINQEEFSCFSMCRPPGHHAASDAFGGYCFFNNSAIAAQAFLDNGAKRVGVLDVDFHHGNGTQQIFFNRSDVMFVSLHGDPLKAFPHFLGFHDEVGYGDGEGFNFNYPLGVGTQYDRWAQALDHGLMKLQNFGAEAIVVSLGVDTFKDDPISFFKLESDDFKYYGSKIRKLNKPTLFVMEGGYAVEEIGINMINVLQGFEGA